MKHLKWEKGNRMYRLMWCLGIAIIIAAMASHAPAQVVRPEVQKARAVYTKAKNDFLQTKETVLRLEKEIKALREARPRPELMLATPSNRDEVEKHRQQFLKNMQAYDGKRAKQFLQYNEAIERLNESQKALSNAEQALQLAIWYTPPPILQSVSLRTKTYREVYAAEWKNGISDDLRQKIAEQQRLLNMVEVRIEKRMADRKPFVEQLKTYNDTYIENADAYTNNTYWEIGATSFIEGAGMIAQVFMGDEPGAAVEMSVLVGAAFAKWAVNTKPDYDYVRDLQKFMKTGDASTQDSNETFTDYFTGDVIETVISHPSELVAKCLHLGLSSADGIGQNVMEELVSDTVGKGAAKSIGFGMAVSVIKGMVGDYFRHEADIAKRASFEAFVGGAFIQNVLNKSYQRDAPYFKARTQLRHNILELTQQANCAKNTWTKTVSQSRPLISTDLKDGMQLSLTFSSPINNLPKVSVQGVKIVVKPGSVLPTTSFSGKLVVPAPLKDGTYDYHLAVSVRTPDLFDGDPITIATFDPRKSVWDQTEPVDKGHVIKVVSHEELIKELKAYKKELQDYIAYIDKRFGYNSEAKAFILNSMQQSGVDVAARKNRDNEWWVGAAGWNWQLSNISVKNYLNEHVSAISDSINDLPGMSNIKTGEIQQFRTGMDTLRAYMTTTKAAFQDCWLIHSTEASLLRDKHEKVYKQSTDTFSQYMDKALATDGGDIDKSLYVISQKLDEQAREINKEADKHREISKACLKDVEVDPKKFPAFASLSKLRKSSK